VALVGRNGAGKSTLFHLIMNLLHPEDGELVWFGQRMDAGNEVEIKRKIGYVPEVSETFDDSMTVEEWLSFLSRWYPDWNEVGCRDALVRYNIDPSKKFKELSKGMQRKVSFIHALSCRPEALLLDEPSSGLDPFAWRTMTEDIRAFMEDGTKSVFFATHVMDEVRKLADCIAFLDEGKLLGVYEKDRLLDEWKTFWVEGDDDELGNFPGVVNVTIGEGLAVRLVSCSARETEQALVEGNIPVIRTGAVELDDILWHLMQREHRS
jgi:ABC-2 type transport system ATP-binding protein